MSELSERAAGILFLQVLNLPLLLTSFKSVSCHSMTRFADDQLMQETLWTLPCFGTRTVLWYHFIPFWIDHNSHDLYVSSTWPLHVFANPTGKATAYVHGRVCSQDWAALRVKSMSHCSNPLCPRSLDWAMLAQPWCSPWPSWRPAKRTRAWRRAARSRRPRGRRSPLRWEIAWCASPRETWWTCSPCRGVDGGRSKTLKTWWLLGGESLIHEAGGNCCTCLVTFEAKDKKSSPPKFTLIFLRKRRVKNANGI